MGMWYVQQQEKEQWLTSKATSATCAGIRRVRVGIGLAWVDCFQGENPEQDQPLIKLTRWQNQHAHSAGVKHLCGARCAGTLMDRWMTEQHADPDAHCETK